MALRTRLRRREHRERLAERRAVMARAMLAKSTSMSRTHPSRVVSRVSGDMIVIEA